MGPEQTCIGFGLLRLPGPVRTEGLIMDHNWGATAEKTLSVLATHSASEG